MAVALHSPLIVAFTMSGTTASRISRARPPFAILALTPSEQVASQLALLWGVIAVRANTAVDYEQSINDAKQAATETGLTKTGDQIVIVSGFPFATRGSRNNLRVAEVGTA